MDTDVIIIGAGAVGCAIARELSRFRLSLAVLEKEPDVAGGTSGRNSAVVHAGFNNRPGSLMARLCVEGSRGFEALCRTLDVPYRRTGKLLVAFDDEDMAVLAALVEKGAKNGCRGLRLMDRAELNARLPQVGGVGAMESPNTAIFDPFLYTVALAENAHANGVSFFFRRPVTAIARENGRFVLTAGGETFSCRMLVNSAGLQSGRVSAMAGGPGYRVYPCRGEYFILDQIAAELLPVPVYPAPKPRIGGLGVHFTPTIHGNLLIGPSAEYIDGAEDYATTRPVMDQLLAEARQLLPSFDPHSVIGSFSGVRAKLAPPNEGGFHDFVIQEEPSCPGLVNLVGIESPGMTSSMPIARMVRDIVSNTLPLTEKDDFQPERAGILRFCDQPRDVQARLIAEDPAYGEIICRCRHVTRREICQAIENPLGVRTLSGIKYRAWATTGRCQGGYCLARITEILTREYGLSPEEITLRGAGSALYDGWLKQ